MDEEIRVSADGRDRRRRRDRARSGLVRAALELARETPFREVTVEAIAKRVGQSRSAFYLHFADKQELLLAALEEVAGELGGLAEGLWEREGPPAERVRGAVTGVVSAYADQAGLLRVATEVSTYDDEVRLAWLAIVERFVEATAVHIRSEQRAGLIAEGLEAHPTAAALVWMCERLCCVELGREKRSAAELVAAQVPIWTAALYPGVIPADQLRPGAGESGEIFGVETPDFG